MRKSQTSAEETVLSDSTSEPSLPFPLKQLHRFLPHLIAEDCEGFSLFSSMKFWTILAKQTELGSKSSDEATGNGTVGSETEILKSRLSLDFTIGGFAGSVAGISPMPASIG